MGKLRDKIIFNAERRYGQKYFHCPRRLLKEYSAGELSSRAMSIHQLCLMLSDTVLTIGLSVLFSFIYIFQMGSFAPALVMPGVLVVSVMFLFTITAGLMQQGLSRKRTVLSAKLNGLVFGLFGGIQKVKLAGAEKRAFSKWAKAYGEIGRTAYSPPILIRLNEAISGALTLGGTILLYYFAGRNHVSQSDFIAFSVAYGAVSGAVMSLSGVITTLAGVKPLMEMVQPILDAVQETDGGKKIVTSLSGNIEISNVTFRYDKDGPVILNNISLTIKPGEYVAIVGTSGCGKSTLVRIMLGFEKPEAGSVYYDGNDLESLDVRSVRQCHWYGAAKTASFFQRHFFHIIVSPAPLSTLEDAWRQRAWQAGGNIKAMPIGYENHNSRREAVAFQADRGNNIS